MSRSGHQLSCPFQVLNGRMVVLALKNYDLIGELSLELCCVQRCNAVVTGDVSAGRIGFACQRRKSRHLKTCTLDIHFFTD